MLSLRDSGVPVDGALLTHIQAAGNRLSEFPKYYMKYRGKSGWRDGWNWRGEKCRGGQSTLRACIKLSNKKDNC